MTENKPNTMDDSKPAFHRFNELPPEIQLMVYHEAMRHPGIHYFGLECKLRGTPMDGLVLKDRPDHSSWRMWCNLEEALQGKRDWRFENASLAHRITTGKADKAFDRDNDLVVIHPGGGEQCRNGLGFTTNLFLANTTFYYQTFGKDIKQVGIVWNPKTLCCAEINNHSCPRNACPATIFEMMRIFNDAMAFYILVLLRPHMMTKSARQDIAKCRGDGVIPDKACVVECFMDYLRLVHRNHKRNNEGELAVFHDASRTWLEAPLVDCISCLEERSPWSMVSAANIQGLLRLGPRKVTFKILCSSYSIKKQ